MEEIRNMAKLLSFPSWLLAKAHRVAPPKKASVRGNLMLPHSPSYSLSVSLKQGGRGNRVPSLAIYSTIAHYNDGKEKIGKGAHTLAVTNGTPTRTGDSKTPSF